MAFNAQNDAIALGLGARLLVSDPDNVQVLKVLARVFNRQQKWEEARSVWTRLSELEALNPEPPLQLARIASRSKKWTEAVRQSERALALEPGHNEALRILFSAHVAMNGVSGALDAVRKMAAANMQGKVQPLTRFAEQLFEIEGAAGDALEICTLACAMDVIDAEALKTRARILATLQTDAIAAHLEGDDAAAVQACRDILRTYPQHERANSILRDIVRPRLIEARGYYKAENSSAAITSYETVLAIDPNHAEALHALARLQAKMKDDGMAEEYWRRLEVATPEDAEPVVQVARLRAKVGDCEGAFIRYRKLCTMPGARTADIEMNTERMAVRVLRNAGIKARDLELDEALRLTDLVGALENPPENLVDVRNRIEILSAREAAHAFKAQDNGAAVTHAQRALMINPDNEKALMLMARAAHKVRDYRSALQAWQKLAELQPANLEAWLQQARYHNRFRERERATAACSRLLAIDPAHAEAASILQAVAGN